MNNIKASDEDIANFMRESNSIEGELGLNPGDIRAVRFALSADFTKPCEIKDLHKILCEHLKEKWVGKWRTVGVTVGGHSTPHPVALQNLMLEFCEQWNEMDAWTAHNEFEKIHAFKDFNGRTGRILWLVKAIDEGYDFSISFLHKFYYQTLSHV